MRYNEAIEARSEVAPWPTRRARFWFDYAGAVDSLIEQCREERDDRGDWRLCRESLCSALRSGECAGHEEEE